MEKDRNYYVKNVKVLDTAKKGINISCIVGGAIAAIGLIVSAKTKDSKLFQSGIELTASTGALVLMSNAIINSIKSDCEKKKLESPVTSLEKQYLDLIQNGDVFQKQSGIHSLNKYFDYDCSEVSNRTGFNEQDLIMLSSNPNVENMLSIQERSVTDDTLEITLTENEKQTIKELEGIKRTKETQLRKTKYRLVKALEIAGVTRDSQSENEYCRYVCDLNEDYTSFKKDVEAIEFEIEQIKNSARSRYSVREMTSRLMKGNQLV